MSVSRRRGRRGSASGSSSFWLSFSDMMSVLVLIFIFVIFSMMFTLNEQEEKYIQARDEYLIAEARAQASEQAQQDLIVLLDQSSSELSAALTRAQEAEDEKEQLVIVLSEKEDALRDAQTQLADARSELTIISSQLEQNRTVILGLQSANETLSSDYALLLSEKRMLEANYADVDQQIAALQEQIAARRSEYDELTLQYAALLAASQDDKTLLSEYENSLSLYRQQLTDAQTQLEQMLGVKTQIIRKLSSELKRNNIDVDVDQQTGAIVLPGAMLFDSGQIVLKEAGKQYLDDFLPVYLSVLLSDEFKPYIAEIVIEGHTDSTGRAGTDSYLYNLELSQQRALAVADYILDTTYMRRVLRLSDDDAAALRRMATASGRSFSALKYNADGSENKEASRRVEIKFSLIDEESVVATRQIINN